MREMVFKMERTGLLTEGEEVTLTEGVLPSSYYYTLDTEHDRSLAMSPNIPFTQRVKKLSGKVLKIEENERGFYVTVGIDEP
ncbi:MAG: hypothetical protein II800_08550 [Lachnospiraceae bacterium]|nr:hypothetical protein [Lachnospiraceae bacterium]